ncbi:TPA: hypothetical protein ACH3X1_006051 [Trebouxia sp. C0004]
MIQVPSEMIAADDPRRPRAHCLHCQRIRVLRHGDTCGDCTRDQGGPVHQRGTTVGMSTSFTDLAALDALGQGTVTESASKQVSVTSFVCTEFLPLQQCS